MNISVRRAIRLFWEGYAGAADKRVQKPDADTILNE